MLDKLYRDCSGVMTSEPGGEGGLGSSNETFFSLFMSYLCREA